MGPVSADYTAADGCWFVALAGPGFDDHRNVAGLADRVAGVVVEQPMADLPCGVVEVADTWQALRDLATAARGRLTVPVVGITGSVGKTTTRALTQLALGSAGRVHHTEHNSNGEPGVPLSLLACPADARFVVLELGSAAPGHIERLARVATPGVRVVTAVAPAHLATLGDLDGVAREKGALFDTARAGDTVVVPLADPRVAAMPLPSGVRRVTVGRGGDVELIEARLLGEAWALDARWKTPEGMVTARLPTRAPFVASNAALALAVAWSLRVDLAAAAHALQAYEPVGSRLRRVQHSSGAWFLDDAANASPRSLRAALDLLATLPGRRIAVLGDMLELGEGEVPLHREVVDYALSLPLERLLLVGEAMAAAAPDGVTVVADAAAAADRLGDVLEEGDVVLLKASRALRLDRIVALCDG